MVRNIEETGANPLQIKIITPSKILLEEKAEHVIMSTTEGELGIYANHAPLMAEIHQGPIKIHLMDKRLLNLSFNHGLARVKNNLLTILVHGQVKLDEA